MVSFDGGFLLINASSEPLKLDEQERTTRHLAMANKEAEDKIKTSRVEKRCHTHHLMISDTSNNPRQSREISRSQLTFHFRHSIILPTTKLTFNFLSKKRMSLDDSIREGDTKRLFFLFFFILSNSLSFSL